MPVSRLRCMYGNSNRTTRMPDAATPSATRCMNAESIGAPAPCANKNVLAAVFGPSTRRAAMTIDHAAEHEQGDDERGEIFGDCRRRDDRDRHRQFHRHPARGHVLECLFEDRPAADHKAHDPDDADVRQRLPYMKPHSDRRERHHCDSSAFDPAEARRVVVPVVFARFHRGVPATLDTPARRRSAPARPGPGCDRGRGSDRRRAFGCDPR